MCVPPFESIERLQLFLTQSSSEEFQRTLPFFSSYELAQSLHLLQTGPKAETKHKIDQLFEFIDSPEQLARIGKNFSVSIFLSLLDYLHQNISYQNRLSFILIGLPPSIFSQALHVLQGHHFQLLKHAGLLEPLHYQLTQFIYEGEILKQQIEQKIQEFEQEFISIKPEELTPSIWRGLILRINHFRDQLLDYLERASASLAIVWHTDRVDLVEKLSTINEAIQHLLTLSIGHSCFSHHGTTGLYFLLEHVFSEVFSPLKDDDAAIEGMTRLSIWHLKDYEEIGLLPSIQHPQNLDIESEKLSSSEQEAYHQHALSLVQEQLMTLGIETVGKFKKKHLFSKALLSAYIKEQQTL